MMFYTNILCHCLIMMTRYLQLSIIMMWIIRYSKYVILDRRRLVKQTTKLTSHSKKRIENIRKKKEVIKIVCEWGNKNKVVVNPDGQVLPCCFFCNPHYLNKNDPLAKKYFIEHPVMQKYQKRQKDYNVFPITIKKVGNFGWHNLQNPGFAPFNLIWRLKCIKNIVVNCSNRS